MPDHRYTLLQIENLSRGTHSTSSAHNALAEIHSQAREALARKLWEPNDNVDKAFVWAINNLVPHTAHVDIWRTDDWFCFDVIMPNMQRQCYGIWRNTGALCRQLPDGSMDVDYLYDPAKEDPVARKARDDALRVIARASDTRFERMNVPVAIWAALRNGDASTRDEVLHAITDLVGGEWQIVPTTTEETP